jgi:hypothetical protein
MASPPAAGAIGRDRGLCYNPGAEAWSRIGCTRPSAAVLAHTSEAEDGEVSKRRNLAGTLLIAAGIVIVLGVAGSLTWSQVQGESLRARLRQEERAGSASQAEAAAAPPATPTISPTVLPTSVPSTAIPTLTPRPTPTSTPVPPSLPVRIVIPDLKMDAPVTEMVWQAVQTASGPQAEWVIPENSAGHHANSVSLGVPGNVVISGHNNVFGKVFEPISLAWDEDRKKQVDAVTYSSDILNGRPIQLYSADGRKFEYRVTSFYRLSEAGVSLEQRLANARYMDPTPDAVLTLITCWPPWSNTYRLVVRASLVQ